MKKSNFSIILGTLSDNREVFFMPPYFNAHTHQKENTTLSLVNYFIQEDFIIEDNKLYSTGIHPWHLDKVNVEDCLLRLNEKAKELDAIGEAGLDRAIDFPFEKQIEIFEAQIDIAEKYQKPMVIHCVRAYADILQIRKKKKCKTPWLIHGFMGNIQIAHQLIQKNCYLSFGKALLQSRPKLEKVMFDTPSTFHLFETDDERALKIEDIYQKGSALYKQELNVVIEEKIEIAKNLFPKIEQLL